MKNSTWHGQKIEIKNVAWLKKKGKEIVKM